MGTCHCSICRRASGGIFLETDCGDSLEIEQGHESLGLYHSSGHGERGFCKICGSTLFWRLREGKLAMVSSQAFENPEQFRFTTEIFIDDKPANYEFANQTTKMTGAEFVASLHKGQ